MNYLIEDLFICPKCSLISSSLKPDVLIYDKSYHIKYERYSRSPIGKSLNDVRYLNLCSIVDSDDISILDFGCGYGSFVKFCRYQERIKAKGFDINPYSDYCDIANLFNGHNVLTFWDSLEHLSDPKAIINGLNSKYLLISTPSTDDIEGGTEKITEWHHYFPNEHIHYFNEKSLKTLLQKLGYKVSLLNYSESVYRRSGNKKNIITIGGIRGAH